jgi:outer membrane protein TolC
MLPVFCFAQDKLSLEDYIKQVEQNNPDVRSCDLAIDAMANKVLELDMVYSPLLNAALNYDNDRSGANFNSALQYDKMEAESWNVNLSKKLESGSTLTAGYTNTSAEFNLLFPTSIFGQTYSAFSGYQMQAFIKLDQSLLRDFNSGLTRNGIEKNKSLVLAGEYAQLFRKQQILLKARSAYWNLSLTRDIVDFRKISLDRAERVQKWNEKRYGLDLVEKSDYLQSKAAYKSRQLNLQMSTEDDTNAAKDFNQARGRSASSVPEELVRISDIMTIYDAIKDITYTGARADVLAARAQQDSAEFAKKETYYRSLPELTLSGTASVNGIALNYTDTWNQLNSMDKPAYMIGLNFTVPLDYKTLRKVKYGYDTDYRSAGESLQNTELSAKNDWDQLVRNWHDVKTRIELARQIRDDQNDRVNEMQHMFEKGRTTTFELLNAQNDLDDSTLTLYRLIFEEIVTYAQSELYNTKPIK